MPKLFKIRKRIAGGGFVDQLYEQTKIGTYPVKIAKVNGVPVLLPIRISDFGIPQRPPHRTSSSAPQVQKGGAITSSVQKPSPGQAPRKHNVINQIQKGLRGGMLKLM